MHYGEIVSNQNFIDQVMVAVYHGPKSYTGEDMVEIFTHGGILVTKAVLDAVLSTGIDEAKPGEFTERAYLNGKMDLLQAESVMDMIEADHYYALEIAKKGLNSELSKRINQYRERIMSIIAHIEVNIDYPEFESEYALTQNELIPSITTLKNDIETILNESKKTKLIKEGIKTAIVGKPNVGKSSLLNTLIKEDKAIVTDIAGTTRDVVEATFALKGITLKLLDTAGIRDTLDQVESIGIEKTKKTIKEAQLILFIHDVSEPYDVYDSTLLDFIKETPHIIIGNKKDLGIHEKSLKSDVLISTKTKDSLEQLEESIIKKFELGNLETRDLNFLSNQRQIELLTQTLNHLNQALENSKQNVVVDVIQLDLRHAWEALTDISGSKYHESLVEDMFRRFCLGK
jgi:tRNA modification GTPase